MDWYEATFAPLDAFVAAAASTAPPSPPPTTTTTPLHLARHTPVASKGHDHAVMCSNNYADNVVTQLAAAVAGTLIHTVKTVDALEHFGGLGMWSVAGVGGVGGRSGMGRY